MKQYKCFNCGALFTTKENKADKTKYCERCMKERNKIGKLIDEIEEERRGK